MKKLLALVLALVMTLSLCTISNAAFTDAKDVDASYEEAVAVLNGMGVFKGYEDGSFKPEGSITRAEVAAIVYRLYTGDVKDKQAGLYAGYGKFNDMAGAAWATGYIGFCANAGFVKGYGDGKFGPSDPVTGYQALAMILRAVGYGKNGEFEGADWELHVAQIAQQVGALKNVKGVSLKAAASRQLVAELLFQVAANVPTVTYTPAFGYVTADIAKNVKDETLGWKNFNLAKSEDGEDAWGRPNYKWFSDDDKDGKVDSKETKYATVKATPVMTFTEATSECDICEELGESKEAVMTSTWKNGVESTTDVTLKATATKATKGAQGQLVEIYEEDDDYRMVIIDTYLAKVTKVVEEKTDKNGHVISDAYLQLTVYTDDAGETLYVEGNDYEKGDYVLVNVNDEDDNDVTITGLKGKQTLVEIVAAAESFDGAQSKIWYNASKRTIDDEDYMVACQFNHDEAGTSKTKYTWFLDQYGNVIGSVEIETKYSYAVLKDLIWVVGKPGHAEATLVYMNGEEDTVTVASLDGYTFDEQDGEYVYAPDDAEPELTDAHGDVGFDDGVANVSSDSKYNAFYDGYALYRVHTNDDDEVILDLVDGNDPLVYYTEEADFSTNKVYAYGFWAYVSDETEFLVREVDDDDNVKYVTYTRDELPKYAEDSVSAWLTVDKDNYLTRVYIKNAKDAADFDDHLFVITDSYYRVAGLYNTYKMDVVVNGVEKTICTNKDNADILAANKGKLFHVDYADDVTEGFYGFVEDLYLINEYEEGDCFDNDTWCEYVSEPVLKGNTLSDKPEAYGAGFRITDDTKFVGIDSADELEDAIDDEKGIWVIAGANNNQYDLALIVYVGEKLSTSTELVVTAEGGTAELVDGEWVVTSKKGEASMELTYTGDAANTVIVAPGKNVGLESVTETVYDNNETREVIVYDEAATVYDDEAANKGGKVYTVRLVWVKSDDNNALAKVTVDGTSVTLAEGNADAAVATPVELNQTDEFTLVATAESGKATVKVGSGTAVDLAVANLQNTNTVTVTGTTGLNGGYVVIQITAESGAVVYYVYKC